MSKQYNITLIDGDGIGPEITKSVVDIIESTGLKIDWDSCFAGARAIEKFGEVFPRVCFKKNGCADSSRLGCNSRRFPAGLPGQVKGNQRRSAI